jgi:hypothetical protein
MITSTLHSLGFLGYNFLPQGSLGLWGSNALFQVLDAIDRKIELHKKKKALLEELFKSLLHKLMTGEIRVEELDLAALRKDE